MPGRDYETAEWEVSFLATDSKAEHETGEPVSWRNRISVKSRVFQAGEDRRVELQAAPPAPIRYTTGGSDPKLAGGHYDGPFTIHRGTRYVLAVAESHGIQSDVHMREFKWDTIEEMKPIDPNQPATWRPDKGFSFTTTPTAYAFIEWMKKHCGKAGVQRIAVLDGRWADRNLADGMTLPPEEIEVTVERLRALVGDGEVNIEASCLDFETGQQLLDYAQEIKADLKRDEVEP